MITRPVLYLDSHLAPECSPLIRLLVLLSLLGHLQWLNLATYLPLYERTPCTEDAALLLRGE